MVKKIILSISLCILAAGAIYTAGWFYVANVIDTKARDFIGEQAKKGVRITGALAYPQGFPGKYKIQYSGDILTPNATIAVPLLEIEGWPLPKQEILFRAPLGLRIDSDDVHSSLRNIENADLNIIIPSDLPEKYAEPFVRAWQETGKAQLEVPALTLQWSEASIFGKGIIALDHNLQPTTDLQLGVTNYTFFLDIIEQKVNLKEHEKFLVLTFLSALKKSAGIISIPIKIKDSALYIHIVRVGEIPKISWPRLDQEPR